MRTGECARPAPWRLSKSSCASLRQREEVRENARTVARQHRFGMKLHSERRVVAMCDRHEQAFSATGNCAQGRSRNARLVHDQRMVARGGGPGWGGVEQGAPLQ